jgi:hypothetical protein
MPPESTFRSAVEKPREERARNIADTLQMLGCILLILGGLTAALIISLTGR